MDLWDWMYVACCLGSVRAREYLHLLLDLRPEGKCPSWWQTSAQGNSPGQIGTDRTADNQQLIDQNMQWADLGGALEEESSKRRQG
jgi:hypothetical protein